MTNFQVYKKTLGFSFIRILVGLCSFAILAGLTVAGFFIADGNFDSRGLIGALIGFLISLIPVFLIDFFVANKVKAAQISMMSKGVVEGELPEHTIKAGFDDVKGRFGRIATYYLITRAIKGIFHQISRVINKLGTAIGGDVGNGITSAINSAVEILIGFLCDCCLGWIIYRKDVNPFRAGCEGCVIFFKHGKALIRNIGRIFGMGFLSLLIIGGTFFGLSYLVFYMNPAICEGLVREFMEIAARDGGVPPEIFMDPFYVSLMFSAAIALIIFFSLHGILVRPFILVGVLRNYMNAGLANIPTESEFSEVAAKSPKFRKLQSRIE